MTSANGSPAKTPPAAESSLPFVSIVMPVRNEKSFIERSLGAVLAQDYPRDCLEILVVDGMSTDGTRERLFAIAREHSYVRVLDNPGRIVSTGLNTAMRLARGEIVIRVDGHCEIPPDYVSKCVRHLLAGGVDGVGGSVETVGETWVARVIAAAMSSPFGVGNSAFRTRRGASMLADTIPFPAYTRSAIERAGFYDEELVRNQDDEYNYRLRKLGARLLLAADIRCRYYSRARLRRLLSQYFQYGTWKVRVLQKHPRQMRPRQFVPPLFVLALLTSGGAAVVIPACAAVFIAILSVYGVASFLASALVARRAGWSVFPLLPLAFAILHVGYGAGFLWGLIRFRQRWRQTTLPVEAGS